MLLEPCRVQLWEPKPGQDAPELGKQVKSDNNQLGKLILTWYQFPNWEHGAVKHHLGSHEDK